MILSLNIEEIQRFPQEIKEFLVEYMQNQVLAEKKQLNKNFERLNNETKRELENPSYSEQNFEYTKKEADVEISPKNTRIKNRMLIANSNFDWETMFATEFSYMEDNDAHDLYYSQNEHNQTEIIFNPQGGNIDKNNPKSWGYLIIFLCMFGFGGEIKGLKPAKSSKELAQNFKKIGLSGDQLINLTSIGPLLKSITSMVEIYASKFLEGPPYKDIHWFNFYTRTGNFYFAGETERNCYKAAGWLAKRYFKEDYNTFKKWKVSENFKPENLKIIK